jgi:hypothetical protein
MRAVSVGISMMFLLGCMGMDDPRNDMAPSFPNPGETHAHTIFLQFDGVDVSPANQGDARTGESELVRMRCHVPAFDATQLGADARQTIAATMAALYANYNLRVVTERPTDTEDYVMVVIGGQPTDIGAPTASRGYAPLDCSDDNPHDIVFVFSDALAQDFAGDAHAIVMSVAVVASQETAHSFGLVHTDNSSDVMYPYVEYPSGAQHFASGKVLGLDCGRSSFQDSANLLMQIVGPRN